MDMFYLAADNIESIDVENRTVTAWATTEAIDRVGDKVIATGIELKNYLDNPVILWQHQHNDLPVGKAVNLIVAEGQGIKVTVKFATHPFAESVWQCFVDGVLRAFSVGLRILEAEGPLINRSELLEISTVNVPANQEALAKSVEGKALNELARIETASHNLKSGATNLLNIYRHYVKKDQELPVDREILEACAEALTEILGTQPETNPLETAEEPEEIHPQDEPEGDPSQLDEDLEELKGAVADLATSLTVAIEASKLLPKQVEESIARAYIGRL